MVELALALHRGNGIADVIHLLSSRIGHYFTLYTHQAALCHDKPLTIYELLGEFTRGHELNSQKDQNEFIYSKNVFRVIPLREDELVAGLAEPQVTSLYRSAGFRKQLVERLIALHRENPITASILYALFISNKMSDDFRRRLEEDYNKPVHNGLLWNDKPKTLLHEIRRLFAKSSFHNYFYIRSSPRDQVHYMWESFTKQNLLLTTLVYKYHFRYNFLDVSCWDVLLCVSESGSLIDFLPSLQENPHEHQEILTQLQKGDKRIVIVCSYETVRQQHCLPEEDKQLPDLIDAHKRYIAGLGWHIDKVDLLLLPYWQHNHHSISFLKRGKATKNEEPFYFFADRSKREGFFVQESYYY